MTVRIPVLVALLASGGFPPLGAAEPDAAGFDPKMPGLKSFETIWQRSPFIVETVAVQTTEGLATRYAIVGIASIANQPVVFMMDKNNSGDPVRGRFVVSKGRPSADGIELVSVAVDRDPRKSSVVLKQAGRQAVLTYEATQLGSFNSGVGGGAVPPPPQAYVPPPPMPPSMPGRMPVNRVEGESNPAAPPLTAPPVSRRIIRPAINVDQ